jgi:hypothetical protein
VLVLRNLYPGIKVYSCIEDLLYISSWAYFDIIKQFEPFTLVIHIAVKFTYLVICLQNLYVSGLFVLYKTFSFALFYIRTEKFVCE